jgi:26S proteasome regulatory complex component
MWRTTGTPPKDVWRGATDVRAGGSAYGLSESESRPSTSGSVRDSTGRGTNEWKRRKKPAKNDKTERNINDFSSWSDGGPTELSDLQAAIVEREIRYGCEGACVDGFGNRNSPRRRSSPRGLYFSRGCASGLFRLLDRNTSFFLPSPDHPGGLRPVLPWYESPQIKKRDRLVTFPLSFGVNTAGVPGG